MRANNVSGASVELQNLVKTYGNVVALDGVSLTIQPGEFVTLLGASGSGKTTTLNMIAGFVAISSGEILMHERPISALPPYRRNIGVVFQNYALFPHMTAAENIAFSLKQRKVPRAEINERVADALELVRLGTLGNRHPRQLSGGQQQRVALARAIVFNPSVLLMDEPLGALDKNLREWLQVEITRIHRELGITVLYVTHDQEEALVLSDRIAVLSEGRIEQVGTAEELYEQPKTLYAARFIGESNIFPGRVEQNRDVITVIGDGYHLYAPRCRDVTPWERGVVMVRPERLHIHVEGAACRDEENVLSGTVRRVIYLGSSRKLEVQLSNGQVVLVREQSPTVSAVRDGDSVAICWSARDSVLLPDQAVEPDGEGETI